MFTVVWQQEGVKDADVFSYDISGRKSHHLKAWLKHLFLDKLKYSLVDSDMIDMSTDTSIVKSYNDVNFAFATIVFFFL